MEDQVFEEIDEEELQERVRRLLSEENDVGHRAFQNLAENLDARQRRQLLSDTVKDSDKIERKVNEYKSAIRDEMTLCTNTKTHLRHAEMENARLRGVEQELIATKDHLLRTKNELDEANSENNNLQEQVDDLEEKNQMLEYAKDDAEKEIEKLKRQLGQAKENMLKMTMQNEKLRTQKQTIESRYEDLHRDYEHSRNEIRRIQQATGSRVCQACGADFDTHAHKKIFFPRCSHAVGASCIFARRRDGEPRCPLEHNY